MGRVIIFTNLRGSVNEIVDALKAHEPLISARWACLEPLNSCCCRLCLPEQHWPCVLVGRALASCTWAWLAALRQRVGANSGPQGPYGRGSPPALPMPAPTRHGPQLHLALADSHSRAAAVIVLGCRMFIGQGGGASKSGGAGMKQKEQKQVGQAKGAARPVSCSALLPSTQGRQPACRALALCPSLSGCLFCSVTAAWPARGVQQFCEHLEPLSTASPASQLPARKALSPRCPLTTC